MSAGTGYTYRRQQTRPPKGVHPFPDQEFWTLEEWEENIRDVILEAEAEGNVDFGGGVPTLEIIARVPRSKNPTTDAIKRLVDEGVLLQLTGTCRDTGRKRYSYCLADPEVQYTSAGRKITPATASTEGKTEYQSPWEGRRLCRRDWAAEYELIPDFLPFAYLPYSPFTHLAKITEFLESRPDYCKGVEKDVLRKRLKLPDSTPAANLYYIERAAFINGWWRRDDVSASGTYFANPDYRHGHSEEWLITDLEERLEYIKECLWYGLGTECAAIGCGLTGTSIREYYCPKLNLAQEHYQDPKYVNDGDDASWQVYSEMGRRRRDHTYHTLCMWGYSHREVAEAFGIASATVGRARRRTSEYDAPGDPTFDIDANDPPGGLA